MFHKTAKARAGNALATELALKARGAFNASEVCLRLD